MLNTFEAQPLSDEEGDANNLEEEAATFNIKYLTSSKLMGLEVNDVDKHSAFRTNSYRIYWFNHFYLIWLQLKDPSFRRHVLLQCLILFDYLKVVISEPLSLDFISAFVTHISLL